MQVKLQGDHDPIQGCFQELQGICFQQEANGQQKSVTEKAHDGNGQGVGYRGQIG